MDLSKLPDFVTEFVVILSTTPIYLYMTSIFLACLLWWLVGVLCFSTSATTSAPDGSKNNNSDKKSYSNVEAFRNLFVPHRSLDSSLSSSSGSKSNNLFISTSEALGHAYRDLAPPFNIMDPTAQETSDDNIDDNVVNAEKDMTEQPSPKGIGISNIVPGANITHFCFLMHGHRGLSRDLAYFQTVMERWVAEELMKQSEELSSMMGSNSSSTHLHDMVVHNALCNEGKTQDGVENGGERLVEEMRQVIENEMKKRHPELNAQEEDDEDESSNVPDDNENSTSNKEDTKIFDITISILGNSLGGLFGRYAIAKLVEKHCVKEELPKDSKENAAPCWILDGKYRLHLNIFCTTATPHLGVSGHTWVRIPRTAEMGIAHALGQSGKDLFRLNDLLHTMATSPTFLKPLGAFRKRIAYANCYGTDFAVPVGTAAFLSENSTYPHHFSDDYVVDENGMVIAALHTPAKEESTDEELEEHSDELHEMSSSLDKLGWKKVFVDIRKEMPSVEIPEKLRFLVQKKESSDSDGGAAALSGSNHSRDSQNSTASGEEHSENAQSLQALKKQKVVGSKDIANAVGGAIADNRVALPIGHNMIVAFSRSRLTTFVNKGGRPVVDALAKELVDDIFSWDGTSDPPPPPKPVDSSLREASDTSAQSGASRLTQSCPPTVSPTPSP